MSENLPTTPPALVKIASVVLAAPAATIDLPGIPATFRHLRIEAMFRTDAAALSDNAFVSLNGDAADANYDLQTLQGSAAVASAVQVSGAAFSRAFAVVTGATAQAGSFARHLGEITGYADPAKLKIIDVQSALFQARAAGNYTAMRRAILWANVAPVNRLTFAPSTGPNFAAGSFVDLYGVT